MDLIQRAKNITLSPKSEWINIESESTSTGALYKGYIVPLAAIGPVATFIGLSVVGMNMAFMGSYRMPISAGLSAALVNYLFGLVSVYLIALVINALAPTFNGQKNMMQALKVTAYAYTPAWLASALMVLPSLGLLILLASLYSLYVLYLGLPVLMKAPQEKAVGYTVVVVICAIVLSVIAGAVTSAVTGFGMAGMHMQPQMSEKMEAVGKKLEEAKNSADQNAQVAAVGAALGTALGGNPAIEVVDQAQLKALLPDSLEGMKRINIEAEKTVIDAFKMSKAHATYHDEADPARTIELAITDIGANKMFGGVFAWRMIEQDKETEDGYEKLGKVNGRPTRESFQKSAAFGEYDMLVGERFYVEVSGNKVDMALIKKAAFAADLGKLESMKNQGVKQ